MQLSNLNITAVINGKLSKQCDLIKGFIKHILFPHSGILYAAVGGCVCVCVCMFRCACSCTRSPLSPYLSLEPPVQILQLWWVSGVSVRVRAHTKTATEDTNIIRNIINVTALSGSGGSKRARWYTMHKYVLRQTGTAMTMSWRNEWNVWHIHQFMNMHRRKSYIAASYDLLLQIDLEYNLVFFYSFQSLTASRCSMSVVLHFWLPLH